jgi:hypothetical protein
VGGRTSVRFTEYYAGYPVEGGRLTVTLLPTGRVEAVTGRFVYFPHPRLDNLLSAQTAQTDATTHYVAEVCGGDATCAADVAAENAAVPPVVTPVVLSAELLTGTTLGQDEERLAYRVAYPRRVLYWDARAGGELFGYETTLNAIPHTISNGAQNNRVEITNGVPTAGLTPDPDSVKISGWLNDVDTKLVSWGRNGFDNAGSRDHRAGARPVRSRERRVVSRWFAAVLRRLPDDHRRRPGRERRGRARVHPRHHREHDGFHRGR